tara:strand:- start:252 stop:605 length:354 start_codon:yes stop_codon:yes gene_type:complete
MSSNITRNAKSAASLRIDEVSSAFMKNNLPKSEVERTKLKEELGILESNLCQSDDQVINDIMKKLLDSNGAGVTKPHAIRKEGIFQAASMMSIITGVTAFYIVDVLNASEIVSLGGL